MRVERAARPLALCKLGITSGAVARAHRIRRLFCLNQRRFKSRLRQNLSVR